MDHRRSSVFGVRGTSPKKVIPIVVTYHPHRLKLQALLEALLQQVTQIIIVGNCSNLKPDELPPGVTLLTEGENLGLAAGHNLGIRQARTQGASHVVLFDQDSLPAPGLVTELLKVWDNRRNQGCKVGAVGPTLLHPDQKYAQGFIRFGRFGFLSISCNAETDAQDVDLLLTSGTLIPIESLDEIGDMDTNLFIDHVDTDWCLRATALGYRLYGSNRAHMLHTVGEQTAQVRTWRTHQIALHPPLRYYYIIRNSILLHQRSHANRRWKNCNLISMAKTIVYFGLFADNRWQNLHMLMLGIWDGLRGIGGRRF